MIRTDERADSMSKMKFATAINCMDGRTQLPVVAYLKEKCKVDCVDIVTEAGPVRILADSADRALVDSIKHRVEISTKKHGSRHIAVVGHFDCVGNPVNEGRQREQIRKSIKTVLSWNFKANVLGLWVDENWTVHDVNDGKPNYSSQRADEVKSMKLKAKAPHKASFDYSVVFKKGDKVKVGKEDPEMPGWFWCENKDGVWSWIPHEYLTRSDSEGTITHDYDTTELTVAVGEILECLREVSFWTFCRTSDGRKGWVPTKNLERINE